MNVVQRLLTLSPVLLKAIEEDQTELVATLMVERQQLLLSLGGLVQAGKLGPEERTALQEADRSLREAVQRLRDAVGNQLMALQQQRQNRWTLAPSASYIDRFS